MAGVPIMPENQTILLQRCLDRWHGGDEAARNELLQHACGRLLRLARKMRKDFPGLRHSDDTDDVLQNALIRLNRALRKVTVHSLKDFFHLAALQIRRELLDLAKHHARVRRREARPDGPGPKLEPSDDTHDPSRLAWWTEFHRQVEALPEKEKEVVDLLWYQELTQAEAAALLKVDVRTVKLRWAKARMKLGQQLHGAILDV
jgi:RNA polymerase sigma-70 factor (ECF subfamily)